MISYRFVPISSQERVLFLRHPVCCYARVTKLILIVIIEFIFVLVGF